jgi:hypothetical protein
LSSSPVVFPDRVEEIVLALIMLRVEGDALWRAGHAHAGVWLVLSLVTLRYVDEAALSEG